MVPGILKPVRKELWLFTQTQHLSTLPFYSVILRLLRLLLPLFPFLPPIPEIYYSPAIIHQVINIIKIIVKG